jgi:hypothetical protein
VSGHESEQPNRGTTSGRHGCTLKHTENAQDDNNGSTTDHADRADNGTQNGAAQRSALGQDLAKPAKRGLAEGGGRRKKRKERQTATTLSADPP